MSQRVHRYFRYFDIFQRQICIRRERGSSKIGLRTKHDEKRLTMRRCDDKAGDTRSRGNVLGVHRVVGNFDLILDEFCGLLRRDTHSWATGISSTKLIFSCSFVRLIITRTDLISRTDDGASRGEGFYGEDIGTSPSQILIRRLR